MSLSKLVWTKELSMFNKTLDNQHKTLFIYINEIIQLEELTPKSGLFAEVLSRISNYGLEHFKTEERLMIQMDYPKAIFARHKAEHKSYLYKVAMFNTNFLQAGYTEPDEVIDFLKVWWTNHIMFSDMHLSLFIRQNMEK